MGFLKKLRKRDDRFASVAKAKAAWWMETAPPWVAGL